MFFETQCIMYNTRLVSMTRTEPHPDLQVMSCSSIQVNLSLSIRVKSTSNTTLGISRRSRFYYITINNYKVTKSRL